MDRFERAILPLVWKRYVDDILCIWTGTRSELDSFLDRLNKAHRTLSFTWSLSNERLKFLDLNIFKGGKFITTKHLDISTHFKTIHTFQYLHFSPSHPRSVFKGLVKGEAIRFLHSNTDEHTYYNTIHTFKNIYSVETTPNALLTASLGTSHTTYSRHWWIMCINT